MAKKKSPKPKPSKTVSKKVYSLSVNGEEIAAVSVEVPDWFPFTPRINQRWLKSYVERSYADWQRRQK